MNDKFYVNVKIQTKYQLSGIPVQYIFSPTDAMKLSNVVPTLITHKKTDFIIIGTSRQAANLLIPSLRTSLVIASHHQTLYVILVLHLIAILISEKYVSDMSLLQLQLSSL